MAKLTFTEKTVTNGKVWEATATVNADFNLHLERVNPETVTIEVSTVQNGQYQVAYARTENEVFDHDFNALVYPKYIKITSWSKPLDNKCYITEGE